MKPSQPIGITEAIIYILQKTCNHYDINLILFALLAFISKRCSRQASTFIPVCLNIYPQRSRLQLDHEHASKGFVRSFAAPYKMKHPGTRIPSTLALKQQPLVLTPQLPLLVEHILVAVNQRCCIPPKTQEMAQTDLDSEIAGFSFERCELRKVHWNFQLSSTDIHYSISEYIVLHSHDLRRPIANR